MKSSILILSLALASPAVFAGGLGVLKPGARPAPATGAARQTEKAFEPLATNAKPDFYGIVLSSTPNISTFRAGYSPAPEKVMDLEAMSGYSGTAVGSDFYYMDYAVNSSGSITAVNWRKVDMDSKTVTASIPQQYAIGVCMDMTYDVTTSTVYGISAVSDVLVSINTTTGEATPVAQTLPFYTISADAAGQLYGIALDSETRQGVLYSVNKVTGSALKIGSTGVRMLTDESGSFAAFQTAAFSSANGQLYWTLTNSDNASALYRVDVTTGAAAYMAAFPDDESFVSLFDLPAPVATGAPAPVRVDNVEAAESYVTIEFTAPAVTASGEALAALTSLEIFRGNSTEAAYSVETPLPGESYRWTDTEAKAGFNSYRLVAGNGEGESPTSYASAFCGEDYPSAPTDVTVMTDASGAPVISWTAPATGLNGLPLDPDRLSYSIQRDINGRRETIAENISGSSYTDISLDLSRQLYPYYYVTASTSAGEGRPSAAAGTYTGPAYRLPLTEAFLDGNPSTAPWIMQSLDLGGAWEMSLLSTFPGRGPYVGEGMLVFIGFRAVDGAEARIATPLISFENASYPELRFHFYYLDMSDQDLRFDDHMVVEVSVDGGEFRAVQGADYYQHDANSGWTECVLPLPQYAGCKNIAIGFHGYSAGGFDLLLDNIRVSDNPSGAIDSVNVVPEEQNAEYYDLRGLRVDPSALTPGFYIRRTAGTTEKIIIR
jgi:hypothetical protein